MVLKFEELSNVWTVILGIILIYVIVRIVLFVILVLLPFSK